MKTKTGGSLILGIETSCDETASAVVKGGKEILSNVISSQVKWHRKFRGVVPEIASRKHVELINPVIEEALLEAEADLDDISAIAVTLGPGLIGALVVGVATGKAISYVRKIPAVGVNHLEGHIYANFLEHPSLFPPFVSLVVSGGHTSLIYVADYQKYEVLGQTLDDAAGEAFDKIAGFLDLGYPGGPAIDKLAKSGDAKAMDFPRAMIKTGDYDFSLSGLKTAVLNYVSRSKAKGEELSLPDLAASFEAAVVDVQVAKTIRAACEKRVETIVLAGGVAANTSLREKLTKQAKEQDIGLFYPSLKLCTDNAAMVAACGYWRLRRGERLSLDAVPDANLSLV